MKKMRMIRLVLALMLIMSITIILSVANQGSNDQVANVLYLGSYEQDNNQENGKEPIAWLIANVQDDQALLISKQALDCLPFNDENIETTWETSTLRSWLEDVFLGEAFTQAERDLILPNANATNERVFLLAREEVTKLFSEAGRRKLTGTEFARANGAKFLGFTTMFVDETDWWLSSVGEKTNEASYVDVKGNFGSKKVTDKLGIRPALWVRLNVDRSFFPYELYFMASDLERDGKYEEAAEIYESLGTYNGSHERSKHCRYLQAAGAMEASDFHTALRLFENLGDYQDSYTNGRACRYAIAVDTQENGNYEEAIKLFAKVGQ